MTNNFELEKKFHDLQERLAFLEEKEAIRDLLSQYSFNVDTGQFDKAVGFWSDDCEFISDATGETKTYRGRKGMKTFLSYAAEHLSGNQQHLQLDYVIEVEGNTAQAVGYQIITVPDGKRFTIDRAGFRSFRFIKQQEKWFIAEAVSHLITDQDSCRDLISFLKGTR